MIIWNVKKFEQKHSNDLHNFTFKSSSIILGFFEALTTKFDLFYYEVHWGHNLGFSNRENFDDLPC